MAFFSSRIHKFRIFKPFPRVRIGSESLVDLAESVPNLLDSAESESESEV